MQTLVIEGYLAADPSILSAQSSGRKRASFRVLETTRYRRADGEQGERTTGFNCVCFNEATTENYIAPYARKGSRVIIQGHVENDSWTGKDGAEHYDVRVVVEDMRLKNRRSLVSTEADAGDAYVSEADSTALNDDIPF
ncbi:single-stranded DNA-binding protein [Brevundimonas naejangsanensis]|uniref:Single-stranded DNA-binding protein n=1 Tax=Brevundimonas naejangsanensis TaxID=588932 RepID=A0A172Y4K7_9CAUL|nr:single-stranded DNA-binding protein [Brevundimonas naejangsanensis]ANF54035.1 single-stranded DNA-binding protein [Brevundimonas naejangsanensis]